MTKEYAEKKIREEYQKIVEANDQILERIDEDECARRAVIALLKENTKVFYCSANVVVSIFIEIADPDICHDWRDLFNIVCDLTNELTNRIMEIEEGYVNG